MPEHPSQKEIHGRLQEISSESKELSKKLELVKAEAVYLRKLGDYLYTKDSVLVDSQVM